MNKKIEKNFLLAVVLAALLIGGIAFAITSAVRVAAEVSFSVQTEADTHSIFPFFTGTTTTATSTNLTGGGGYFKIAGAKKVALTLSRGGQFGPNTGSTAFRVQVTNDPVAAEANWFYFGDMESATSTTAYATDTITLSGTTTARVVLDLNNRTYWGLRLIAVETTDGEHTASASAQF